jgi:hypothetical protein
MERIMNKKSLIVAAALATSAFAGDASALNVLLPRTLFVPGLARIPGVVVDTLGVATFTALGIGSFATCNYLMNWINPFNPNWVASCIVTEALTPFDPSCLANSLIDITTFVGAGVTAIGGVTVCTGFDNLGLYYPAVSLALGEDPIFGLSGVAVYSDCIPTLVLPIGSVFC